MGKVRNKRSRWRHRPQPTGIPSVRETEELEEERKEEASPPVLEKLSSLDAGEREWACHSLSHLVQDRRTCRLLTQHRMLRRVLPLLLDREWAVREAAAGALRNVSACEDEEVCGCLVKEDVMTVLSAMLKECVSQLQTLTSSTTADQDSLPSPSPSSSSSNPTPSPKGKGRRGKGKPPETRVLAHQVMSVAEQGLHLLLNMSEWSGVVVEVANQEQLVSVLLYFLQPSLLTPTLVTTAATCLYTLTEDNPPSHHLLTSSPSHLSQLETLLSPSSQPASHLLIVSASIAGVFQHLLPTLPPSTHHHIPKLVFSVLMGVLGTDVSPLLHTLTSTPPPTPPQAEDTAATYPHKEGNRMLEDLENILSAQQLALEVTANLCYTESEVGGSDGGDWEDDGEEEEVIGGDMEDIEETPMDQGEGGVELPPTLTAVIMELGIVEMVWKKCAPPPTPSSLQASFTQEPIITSIHTVQSRAFAALQNLISALPRETLGQAGGVATLWGRVLDLVASGSVAVSGDVTGLLVVLARGMEEKETEGVTVVQAQLLCRLCLEQEAEQQVRADIVVTMAILSRKVLRLSPSTGSSLLQALGAGLRDCVSRDPSLWVVALALDGLFDVFGDDTCPLAVFTSLQIMPVLKNAASFFKARLRVEKSTLGVHSAVVRSARENLPRFIDYMESRTRAS